MSVPEDRIQELLDQGVEIPDDPVEIERLLANTEGDDPPPEEPDASTTDDDTTSDDDKGDKGKDGDGKPAASSDGADTSKEADEAKEPPSAVLRTTRQSLHQSEERRQELETELSERDKRIESLEGRVAALTKAGETDQANLQEQADQVAEAGGVKLEDLSDEKIAEIREEAGDEAADLLQALFNQHTQVAGRLDKLEEERQALEQQRNQQAAEALQNDIDAVPLLSVLQADRTAEGNERWDRAISYDKAVRSDPDWAEKSQREIFAEVGRRMERYLGSDTVKTLTGDEPAGDGKGKDDGKPSSESRQQRVDEALSRADERAVPTSLSDLPAGQAAAQTELERADSMSLNDIEESIDKAYARGGQDAVDELLGRLTTMEPTS